MADDSKPRVPIPAGFRQGVISAISVILGFSLLLLRYWSFEASGEVTRASVVAWLALLIALLLAQAAFGGLPGLRKAERARWRKT
jgi:hypothetical protein